ncbi:MAG: hypothetical protein ABI596_04525 [Pyrinomonadaceae bacterium]
MLRITMALGLAMVLPLVAGAYTLVLRDGRHTEIPATFIVSGKALTYERSPGFNITMQLSIIDIAATERINNEAPGSFMRRSASTAPAITSRSSQRPVSITNANLERWRQARLESEKVYEQRRRALGLPSLEEMRRKQEQETEETLEVLRPRIAAEQAKESYWRGRAGELRSEVAAVEAQINYLQSRLTGLSNNSIGVPPGSVGPFISWGSTRGFRTRPQLSGRVGFGRGTWGGRVVLNSPRRPVFGHGGRVGGSVYVPFRSGFAFPSAGWSSQKNENSYERDTLVQQLDELVGARAGFLARWRLLEEEARRAGAYPGWLRP